MDPNNELELFSIEDYNHFSVSQYGKGGGVRFYCLQHLNVKVIEPLSSIFPTHESIFIDVKFKNGLSFIFGLIYRPPRFNFTPFHDYVRDILLTGNKIQGRKSILLGDFNLDFNIKNNTCVDFTNTMTENGYDQYVQNNTHCINGLANSLLDHIWCNFDFECKAKVFDYLLSDHLGIGFGFRVVKDNPVYYKKYRDFSPLNLVKFDNEWTNIMANSNYRVLTTDLNTETERFSNWLTSVINQCFPIKTKQISVKRLNSPWITPNAIYLINKKHKLFIKMKTFQITYIEFNEYCKLLKLYLQKVKTKYYNDKFVLNNKYSKKQWKTINQILGRGKKKKVNDIEVTPGGSLTNNENEIAKILNNFFSSIGDTTQSNLNPPLNNYDHLIPENNQSFYIEPSFHFYK